MEQKKKIASEITRIHSDVTGAPRDPSHPETKLLTETPDDKLVYSIAGVQA